MSERPQPPLVARTPKRRGREARRRQLAAHVSRLIRERGFEQLSVNELADGVGISVGGMYRYIKTKSDLLVMACEDIYGDLGERLATTVATRHGIEDQLRAALGVYLDACHANRDLILLMYREYRHLPADAQQRYKDRESGVAAIFADLIRAGMGESVFVPADPDILAQDIILLGHLPALKGWALRGRVDPDRLAREQVALIIERLRSRCR